MTTISARSRRTPALLGLVATVGAAGLLASPALATPTNVNVRIEGVSRTVFDGLVRTDARTVKAESDTVARTCDGTNNGANPTPGPTATGAAVSATDLLEAGFDGDWYDGFDDYFVKAFADEVQNPDPFYYFGVLVNGDFTPVGGCQFRVAAGDQVLWANDAFNGRPFLNVTKPTTDAVVGKPFAVQVAGAGDLRQAIDHPAANPYQGASVQLVDAIGRPSDERTTTTTSDATGKATVTFTQPGWHRIKARGAAASAPGISDAAVPSASVDVCVRLIAAARTCSGPAPSTQLATPTPAKVAFSPIALAFGKVAVGQSKTLTVAVKNTGEVSASAFTASIVGVPAGQYTVSGLPSTLAGGASASISVTYAPTKRGAAAGILHLGSTAGSGLVALSGAAQ
ncbi:MAG: choice-of-anchor D domain-containing protein [Solirubrobacteraceae bacterium]|nr:choice-of-anchor D domain-containing protein [Patulibacter sp.]